VSATVTGTETRGERPYLLTRLYELQRDRPSAVAVVDEYGTTSYRRLWLQATHLSERLAKAGVGRGDVVGLTTGRDATFVVGALAAWLAGAAYLPLDLGHPRLRLERIVADAGPALVVGSAATVGRGADLGVAEMVADGATSPGGDTGPPPPLASADPAYMIYTSGTTGQPKGVVVSHGSLENLVRWHNHEYGVTPRDRALQTASVGFDAAVWEIWPYLAAGATVVVCADDDRLLAPDLADQLREHACTMAFVGTPLAEEMLAMGLVPPGLRYLLTGGDLLRVTGAPPPGCCLVNHYGPTEATVVTTSFRVSDHAVGAIPPIGAPISGARVLLCDDRRAEVADGAVGEIFIGGVGVALGYHRQPELTAQRFVRVPGHDGVWYRTGDLASRSGGVLTFAGRADREQLKVRGVRVEADEIEAALLAVPNVTGAAVTTIGRNADCVLVAYVVSASDIPVPLIREHVAARLPASILPNRYVFGRHLPTTPTGKIDRDRIAALVAQEVG
jgi:amino acid adenylation domain-containing protein